MLRMLNCPTRGWEKERERWKQSFLRGLRKGQDTKWMMMWAAHRTSRWTSKVNYSLLSQSSPFLHELFFFSLPWPVSLRVLCPLSLSPATRKNPKKEVSRLSSGNEFSTTRYNSTQDCSNEMVYPLNGIVNRLTFKKLGRKMRVALIFFIFLIFFSLYSIHGFSTFYGYDWKRNVSRGIKRYRCCLEFD